MSKKASPTVIGFFTLIGLLIAGAAAVLFGAGKYFETTYPVLLFFDKSANGLQVGSDVRFGGVRIGSVKSISVLIDPAENRKIIPVVVSLGKKELRLIGSDAGGGIDFSSREGVDAAVRQGLRAGMKQQSLVTGQLYIEFDILPDSQGFVYKTSRDHELPVVPTVGTQMDELVAGISDGLKKFNALDLEGAMDELRGVLESAKDQISQLKIEEINDNLIAITGDIRKITGNDKISSAVDNLNAALVQIDGVASKANAGIEPLLADLAGVIERTDAGLLRLEEATKEIAQITNPRAPMLMQMQSAVRETERASLALKELSNDIKRNPSTLLRGTANPK